MEKYFCEICGFKSNDLNVFANHNKDTCVNCKNKFRHIIDRSFCVTHQLTYAEVYNDWDDYPFTEMAANWSGDFNSIDKLKQFNKPIDIRGWVHGCYATNLNLENGKLCPNCFKELLKSDKITWIWCH